MPTNLEVLNNIDQNLYLPFHNGLVDTLLTDTPDETASIPVTIAGLSLCHKTTFCGQEVVALKTNKDILDWQERHKTNFSFYFTEFGRILKLGRSAGRVTNPQGFITDSEYDAASDLYQEVVEVGLEYLPRPGALFLETILVTSGVDKDCETIAGTNRGSYRLACDLVRNSRGRMLIFQAPESLKDDTGNQREEFRNTGKDNIIAITKQSQIISDEEDAALLMNYYDDASNKRTRIQQDIAVAESVFKLLEKGFLTHTGPQFKDLDSFKEYYLDHNRKEWEDLSGAYYRYTLGQVFKRPNLQIPPELGSVIFDKPLPANSVIHTFPRLLRDIDLVEGLRKTARLGTSSRLRRILMSWGVEI